MWKALRDGLLWPLFIVGVPLALTLLGVQDLVDYFNGGGWVFALTGIAFLSWAIWDFIQVPVLLRQVNRQR